MLASQRLASGRCSGAVASFTGSNVVSRPIRVRPFTRQTVVTHAQSAAGQVTLPVVSGNGAAAGDAQLALKVANPEVAKGLVHRYLVYVQQNKRRGTASTLTRTEVRGGGKKPYKQKGTGNARRGSSVSPLFPGGGVSFGPKPKDWSISMNKKERRLALATALHSAASDIVVVDSLSDFQEPKTKALVSMLAGVGVDVMSRKALLITKDANPAVQLAARNVAKLSLNQASAIRVFDVLNSDKIVIERAALEQINELYGAAASSE
jgi:large subunit ribosomal protein L4